MRMLVFGAVDICWSEIRRSLFSPALRSNLLLRPGKWQENQSVIAGEAGWGKEPE